MSRIIRSLVAVMVALALAWGALVVGATAATAAPVQNVAVKATKPVAAKSAARSGCPKVCKPKPKPPRCKPRKCKKVTLVKPATPHLVNRRCVAPGQWSPASVDLPSTPGIVYSVAGNPNLNDLAPGTYTVYAKPVSKKYRYSDAAGFVGGRYTFVVNDVGDCKVVIADPTLSATSVNCTDQVMYVTPNGGVGYTWNRDRTSLRPGQSATFTATAAAGHTFSGGRATFSVVKTNTLNPKVSCKPKKKCVKKHGGHKKPHVHKPRHDKPKGHKPRKPCKC